MNALKIYNSDIIKYTFLLNLSLILNYFFWFINSPDFLKILNFLFIIVLSVIFIISPVLKNYFYVKILFSLLFLLILGSPSFSHDLRSIYLFTSKILFYNPNFFETINSYNYDVQKWFDVVNTRPRIVSSLSSSFALLIGFWNEIFPKTTNLFFMLAPILFLSSFFKNKNSQLLFFLLILFLTGKIIVLGLNDGLLGLYFISTLILLFYIIENPKKKNIKFYYFYLFLFASILTLIKTEGTVMLFSITSTYLFFNIYKNKKLNPFIILSLFCSFIPIIMWRFGNYLNSSVIESFQEGNPFLRLFENIFIFENYKIFFHFLITNDKLLISIFLFAVAIFFFKNKRNYFLNFLILNIILYFILLVLSYFTSSYGVLVTLTTSSGRTFIPIMIVMVYYFVYILDRSDFNFKNKFYFIP